MVPAPVERAALPQLLADGAGCSVSLPASVAASVAEALESDGFKTRPNALKASEQSPPGTRTTRPNGSQVASPILRKSATALSSFSLTTAEDKSTVPHAYADDFGGIRPSFGIGVSVAECVTDIFEFKGMLGKGGFGEVWQCSEKANDKTVAVKTLRLRSPEDATRVSAELKVFERLSNPYIVALHEVLREEESLYMVMEVCTGGDLRSCLLGHGQQVRQHAALNGPNADRDLGLPSKQVARYLWQMLAGIAYMHHHRFVHRDIKLSNYMLKDCTENSPLQLIDFGLATPFRRGQRLNYLCGTVTYMAPEVLRKSYTEICDEWGIGIACYILCNARSPWRHKDNDGEIMGQILAYKLREWTSASNAPEELRSVIQRLLTHDGDIRPCAKDLLTHSEWLQRWGSPPQGHGTGCSIS